MAWYWPSRQYPYSQAMNPDRKRRHRRLRIIGTVANFTAAQPVLPMYVGIVGVPVARRLVAGFRAGRHVPGRVVRRGRPVAVAGLVLDGQSPRIAVACHHGSSLRRAPPQRQEGVAQSETNGDTRAAVRGRPAWERGIANRISFFCRIVRIRCAIGGSRWICVKGGTFSCRE